MRVEAALAQTFAGGEVRLLQPRPPELACRLVKIAIMDEQAFGVVAGVMAEGLDNLISLDGRSRLTVDP
jgi:hypothetical protein